MGSSALVFALLVSVADAGRLLEKQKVGPGGYMKQALESVDHAAWAANAGAQVAGKAAVTKAGEDMEKQVRFASKAAKDGGAGLVQGANKMKQAEQNVKEVEHRIGQGIINVEKDVINIEKNGINMVKKGAQLQADKVLQDLHKVSKYTFNDFVRDYNRPYQQGSEEWKKHEAIFNQKHDQMLAHNSGAPQRAWVQGINKFMDHSPEMLQGRLGWKGQKVQAGSSFLEFDTEEPDKELPELFEWGQKLGSTRDFHRDQGSCGSCWAVAAAQVLEDHIQLKHNVSVKLSDQALVSCTPNLMECGGTGGCQGATVELAFDYVKNKGIPAYVNMPYTSGGGSDGPCDSRAAATHVKIGDYVTLPENKGKPLMQALYQHGPVAISVDASNWFMYSGGIFAGCDRDAVINHAVVAEGFGKEKSGLDGNDHQYFLIKNSWGADWGEAGYIKLENTAMAKDNHCGIDHKPEEGLGCKGGPSQVEVCGMCGMFYDSAFPMDGALVSKEQGGTFVEGQDPILLEAPKGNPMKKKKGIQWSAYQLPVGLAR